MRSHPSFSRWSVSLCALSLLVLGLTVTRPTAAQDTGPSGFGFPRVFGLVRAVVVDVQDPDEHGRIKVNFHWRSQTFENWALVSLPVGGNQTGLWALPEVGNEVIVGFESGDPRHPVVIGSLWNGKRPPTR